MKFPSSPDTLRIDHVVAGTTLEIKELTGFIAFYTEGRNRIVRFFSDHEKQPEVVKYVLIILLLVFYNLQLRRSTRNIALFRWLASGFIFIVFVFVNQFFLFEWPSVSILKEKIRNDTFLILKEGLHNIIGHSGARNVEFRAKLAENVCFIRLKDDGVGIDGSKQVKKGSHGNGLVNMRRRAQESDIGFSLQSSVVGPQSSEGSGVEIVLQFKI